MLVFLLISGELDPRGSLGGAAKDFPKVTSFDVFF